MTPRICIAILMTLVPLPMGAQVPAIDLGATSKLSTAFFPNQGTASTGLGTLKTNYAFTSQGSYTVDSWSSCVGVGNRLICKGGGHTDYFGNEIQQISVTGTTGTASRLTDPSAWTSDVFDCINNFPNKYINPDGSPTAAHAFGAMAELPTQNAIYIRPATIPGGCTNAIPWRFNLVDNTWTNLVPLCSGTCIVGGISRTGFDITLASSSSGDICAYDSSTDTAWCVMIVSGILYQYDPATNASFEANGHYEQNQAMTYAVDPIRRQMWGIGLAPNTTGTFRMGFVDISGADSTYAFQDKTSSVSGCSGIIAGSGLQTNEWPGWKYDRVLSRFVGYPTNGGNTIYIFDPGTYTCSTQTFGSPSVPTPSASMFGMFGKFNYLPDPGLYIIVNGTSNDAIALRLNANAIPGMGSTTTTCIDVDGDGYGVGPGCTGPDADDNDSGVHSVSDATTKYGSLAAFINHLGYNPTRLWYLSTTGDDSTCAVGTLASPPSTPCATWAKIGAVLVPGDMALVRGGTWGPGVGTTIPTGSAGSPVIVAAYPGELPFIDDRTGGYHGEQLDVGQQSWIVIDGIKAAGGTNNGGCIGGGGLTTSHITIRHTETTECTDGGIDAFDGLLDWNIEFNVMHDMATPFCHACQHALYMGSRTNPARNMGIRHNLLYSPNEYPALQWNGRVSNLVVEGNIIHGTPQASGMTITNGVTASRIMDNLIFNNFKGINLLVYDGDCYIGVDSKGVCPYSVTGNVIAGNTVYTGNDPGSGASGGEALNVSNRSTTCPPPWDIGGNYSIGYKVMSPYTTGSPVYTALNAGVLSAPPSSDWSTGSGCTFVKVGTIGPNTYINNIFVSGVNFDAVFELCPAGYPTGDNCTSLDSADTSLSTSKFSNNLFKGTGATQAVYTAPLTLGVFAGFTISALNAGIWGSSSNNLVSNPLFASASPSFWNTPASYDLRLAIGSPAVATGIVVSEPPYDLVGHAYSRSAPNMGARETSISVGAGGSKVSGVSIIPGKSTVH